MAGHPMGQHRPRWRPPRGVVGLRGPAQWRIRCDHRRGGSVGGGGRCRPHQCGPPNRGGRAVPNPGVGWRGRARPPLLRERLEEGTMPATTVKLGPGELSVGETGTAVDFTCQVTAAQVEWEVDEGDDTPVLCGETVPGERTYSSHLTGTLFQDLGAASGIVEYSWLHKGEEVPFTFVPNTAAAKQVSGNLILDPLSVGGDEAGANMTSDFDWAIVGEPTLGP